MNFDRLRLVSELADIGALKEAMLATTIPESPGSFRGFIDTALADTNQSVTEFKYRCVTAHVMIAYVMIGYVVNAVIAGLTPSRLQPCFFVNASGQC